MAKIAIRCIGEQKVKVINIVRELLGVSLGEAKKLVDQVESGNEVISEIENVAVALVKLAEAGAYAEEVIDTKKVDYEEKSDIKEQNLENQKVKAKKNYSVLDREETLEILRQVREIAFQLEEYAVEKASLLKKISEETEKAKMLRKAVSRPVKILNWTVTIIFAIIGNLLIPVIGMLLLGILARIIMNCTVKKLYLSKHQEENNLKAEQYIKQNVNPLHRRLDDIRNEMGQLNASGKIEWALDVVGEECFNSEAIDEIYELIKGRRADNLKEAFNLYDTKKHRERIEIIQHTIKDSAEIAANEAYKQTGEAYKQTEILQNINKETRKTKNAARAGAVVGYLNYRNGKKK